MAAGKTRLPPRWTIVTFWHLHRWIVRASGGRGAVASAAGEVWHLAAHRSGPAQRRAASVIVGYYEEGPNLVTMAMNGWGPAEPAWCLIFKPTQRRWRAGRWDPARGAREAAVESGA